MSVKTIQNITDKFNEIKRKVQITVSKDGLNPREHIRELGAVVVELIEFFKELVEPEVGYEMKAETPLPDVSPQYASEPAKPTDEEVEDSVREQLADMDPEPGETVCIVTPEGATEEQYQKAMESVNAEIDAAPEPLKAKVKAPKKPKAE